MADLMYVQSDQSLPRLHMLYSTYYSNMTQNDMRILLEAHLQYTVDPRYLDFGYLDKPLISKRKADPCFNTEI